MPESSSAKPLTELLRMLGIVADSNETVSDIVIDSRSIGQNTVWFALPGAQRHGASFASLAPANPIAVVTDAAGEELLAGADFPVFSVPDPRALVGPTSAWLHGDPATAMTMVAVTGTNGKTSVTHFLGDAWHAHGDTAAVLGTLGLRMTNDRTSGQTGFTTPEADALQRILARARDLAVTHMAMEVSSHALALHRADGIIFDVAVFTNLSQDHLDFHHDMEDYFQAKARLFADGRCRRAVVCTDDHWGRRLAADIDARGIPLITYGTGDSDWQIVSRSERAVTVRAGDQLIELPIVSRGEFTALNLVATAATLTLLGTPREALAETLAACRPVPGRMEVVSALTPQHPQVVVDYAHSPDSVARVLQAARADQGRLIAVLGAGGGRDRGKRPLMGAAASAADVVVVTDDNPRDEDPATIRAAVLDGVSAASVHEIADRRQAIEFAVSMARSGDVVVILGKGAERGQQYGNQVREFDDREVASAALAAWGGPSC